MSGPHAQWLTRQLSGLKVREALLYNREATYDLGLTTLSAGCLAYFIDVSQILLTRREMLFRHS